MVFFTSIVIIFILYYLQSDGLIYALVLALTAELINIFMTHTMAKALEKKLKMLHNRVLDGYKNRIKKDQKTIKELEKLQEDAGGKLYKANKKIKEYEGELALYKDEEQTSGGKRAKESKKTTPPPKKEDMTATPPQDKKKQQKKYIDDLPDGSNRQKPAR
jgi:hypothetical protein